MIRTANVFPDYNFRHYFVNHIKDDFGMIKKMVPQEQEKFVKTEGRRQLREMQRMAIVNKLYAKHPVIVDHKSKSEPPL